MKTTDSYTANYIRLCGHANYTDIQTLCMKIIIKTTDTFTDNNRVTDTVCENFN